MIVELKICCRKLKDNCRKQLFKSLRVNNGRIRKYIEIIFINNNQIYSIDVCFVILSVQVKLGLVIDSSCLVMLNNMGFF